MLRLKRLTFNDYFCIRHCNLAISSLKTFFSLTSLPAVLVSKWTAGYISYCSVHIIHSRGSVVAESSLYNDSWQTQCQSNVIAVVFQNTAQYQWHKVRISKLYIKTKHAGQETPWMGTHTRQYPPSYILYFHPTSNKTWYQHISPFRYRTNPTSEQSDIRYRQFLLKTCPYPPPPF